MTGLICSRFCQAKRIERPWPENSAKGARTIEGAREGRADFGSGLIYFHSHYLPLETLERLLVTSQKFGKIYAENLEKVYR
ncbi:MAG: hypothetical protein ACI4RD_05020 [Kiritimatiellia bacterium]